MKLDAIQSAIRDFFLEPDPENDLRYRELFRHIEGGSLSPERRLQIHRNNFRITLCDALAATFPVVRSLVGEEFFNWAAGNFTRGNPPETGALFQYGNAFPDFLGRLPETQDLPYLRDVARLEWIRNDVYHREDAAVLTPRDLADFPPHSLGGLVLALHPAHRLMLSRYPVEAIWAAHQDGGPDFATIRFSRHPHQSGDGTPGEPLLVIRPFDSIEMIKLEEGAFTFLIALIVGENLTAATEAAVQIDPEFDLQSRLAELLAAGVFTTAKLEGEES